MIDFHTHSFLSDGVLIPSELARRAEAKGYRAIGIADHVDGSNVDFVVPRLVEVCRDLRGAMALDVIAGAEITYVPPRLIASLAERCRKLGAEVVIAHGESIDEPVKEGTNAAALGAKIDILAHPGLLTPDQAAEAAGRGIYLELSNRKGHCLSNGLVARLAVEAGARLLVNTDAHSFEDLITAKEAFEVARAAGLDEEQAKGVLQNAEELLSRIKKRRK